MEKYTIKFIQKSSIVSKEKAMSFSKDQLKISDIIRSYFLWSGLKPENVEGKFVLESARLENDIIITSNDLDKNLLEIADLSDRYVYRLSVVQNKVRRNSSLEKVWDPVINMVKQALSLYSFA